MTLPVTVIKVTVSQYHISRDYLTCLADEFGGRPMGGTKGSSIEYGFDAALNADAFRKVLETTFKPRPSAKPPVKDSPKPTDNGDDQPTGAPI